MSDERDDRGGEGEEPRVEDTKSTEQPAKETETEYAPPNLYEKADLDDEFDLTPVDANGVKVKNAQTVIVPSDGWGAVADEDDVTAPAVQAGFRVIDGGKSLPKDPAAPLEVERLHLRPLNIEGEEVTLDEKYIKDYPRIVEPTTLLDLQITSEMYPSVKGNYLHGYLAWIERSTDAPRAFHLATALATLATAVGRRWRVEDRTPGGLCGNVYFLLIGESGTRKSAALRAVNQLLARAQRWQGAVVSTVSFVEKLKKTPVVLWTFDEAVGLFNMLRSQYAGDIAERLTGAYDGADITYESKASGAITVEEPCLSIVAASPLDWLREKRLSTDILRGGVFGRFFLVPAALGKQKLDPPAPNEGHAQDLMVWLSRLGKMSNPNSPDGSFTLKLTYEAQQTLYGWINWLQQNAADRMLTGAWNRAGTSAKKLALLFHLSECRGPKPIEADVVRMAINLMHYYILPGHLWSANRLVEKFGAAAQYTQLDELLEANPAGILLNEVPLKLGVYIEAAYRVLYALYRAKRVAFWSWRAPGKRSSCVVCTRGPAPMREGPPAKSRRLPKGILKYATVLGSEGDNTEDTYDQAFPPDEDDA